MSDLREVPERWHSITNVTATIARGAKVSGTHEQLHWPIMREVPGCWHANTKMAEGGAQSDSPTHSADPKLKSQSKSHPSIHWADESVTRVQMESNPPLWN